MNFMHSRIVFPLKPHSIVDTVQQTHETALLDLHTENTRPRAYTSEFFLTKTVLFFPHSVIRFLSLSLFFYRSQDSLEIKMSVITLHADGSREGGGRGILHEKSMNTFETSYSCLPGWVDN